MACAAPEAPAFVRLGPDLVETGWKVWQNGTFCDIRPVGPWRVRLAGSLFQYEGLGARGWRWRLT